MAVLSHQPWGTWGASSAPALPQVGDMASRGQMRQSEFLIKMPAPLHCGARRRVLPRPSLLKSLLLEAKFDPLCSGRAAVRRGGADRSLAADPRLPGAPPLGL